MILPPCLMLSHRRSDFESLWGEKYGFGQNRKKCLIVAHKGFGQIKNWALGQSERFIFFIMGDCPPYHCRQSKARNNHPCT